MTIREVEEQPGVTRANVRFYEKEGLIAPKRNPINDYRDYSKEDVEILRRILYLRSLDVSVEQIRKLKQGKANLHEVLTERAKEMETQRKQIEEAGQLCAEMLKEKEITFWNFPIQESAMQQNRNALLKDTLTKLWMFWDKLVVWGFLGIQALYTIVIFPLLPDEIPVSWQGCLVTEYDGRGIFFMYFFISLFLMFGVRNILYQWVVGGLRCYLEELSAILTVGVIGYGFSLQVYTVLWIQGVRVSMEAFGAGCMVGYLVVIVFIVIFYRHYKKVHGG